MRFLKIFVVPVLLVMAFGAGLAVNAARNRDFVKVALVNQAGQPIESFTVRYTTCGTETQITGRTLEVGRSRGVVFHVYGKSDYTVEVTLRDGRVLKGGEGYAVARRSTVNITPKSIDPIPSEYEL